MRTIEIARETQYGDILEINIITTSKEETPKYAIAIIELWNGEHSRLYKNIKDLHQNLGNIIDEYVREVQELI